MAASTAYYQKTPTQEKTIQTVWGNYTQIKWYKIQELNMDKFPRNDNNGKFNKIQDVDLWSNGSDIVQKKSNSDKKLANSKT